MMDVNLLSDYVIYCKLMQCYMSIIAQKNWKQANKNYSPSKALPKIDSFWSFSDFRPSEELVSSSLCLVGIYHSLQK